MPENVIHLDELKPKYLHSLDRMFPTISSGIELESTLPVDPELNDCIRPIPEAVPETTYTLYVDDLKADLEIPLHMLPLVANIDVIQVSTKVGKKESVAKPGTSSTSETLLNLIKDVIASSEPSDKLAILFDNVYTYESYDIFAREVLKELVLLNKDVNLLTIPVTTLALVIDINKVYNDNLFNDFITYIRAGKVKSLAINEVLFINKRVPYLKDISNKDSMVAKTITSFVYNLIKSEIGLSLVLHDLPPEYNPCKVLSKDVLPKPFVSELGKKYKVAPFSAQTTFITHLLKRLQPVLRTDILEEYKSTIGAVKKDIYLVTPIERSKDLLNLPTVIGTWKTIFMFDSSNIKDYKDLYNVLQEGISDLVGKSMIDPSSYGTYAKVALKVLQDMECYKLFYLYIRSVSDYTVEYILPTLETELLKVEPLFIGTVQLGNYQGDGLINSMHYF